MLKKILVLLGCILFVPVYGASSPTTYDIEVLVFENRLPDLEGGELWTRENLRAPAAMDHAEALIQGEETPGDTTLGNAAAALSRDPGYRVLAYRHWRQTAEEKSAAKPIRLRNEEGQLDGAIRFYQSRFLLIDVDVVLQDKAAADGELKYRLSEHRRVRPQEINYFDHPKLGVLVRIAPVGKE